ncbi:MAG: hypothetical protein GWO11_07115 [Desulfuromonadales bacterium]|nr:hypothetical protein [Desulfuromonadales bacterium]NIR34107.1 hypothetical protein [Desulfuromonadales bacterium]NIS41563.1 hypothetical protein [Desulfuromonadales bacterium]
MGITVKPSDLMYKYRRKKETRDEPKFTGKPDPRPFDRDDLYDVIPMFEAVMDALGSSSGDVLCHMEEVMVKDMPAFIETREEVYDCLLSIMQDLLEEER